MSRIVVVHGIGQQHEGPHTLHHRLFPALRQGVAYAGAEISPDDVAFPCYGHFFRPAAEVLAADPRLDSGDVTDGFETELLESLWRRAAEIDARVIPPDEESLSRSPVWAQRALRALNRSAFLSGVAERAFIHDLKQVSAYFGDSDLRPRILAEVRSAITDDTEVVVGHSLGSVVAYELLCEPGAEHVRSLVTLGSPLGLRHLVFDRLTPRPRDDGGGCRGAWPGRVRAWTNVADAGDVVAAVEDLRPLFGAEIRQIRVHNGARAHDMSPYLTDPAVGRALAGGSG